MSKILTFSPRIFWCKFNCCMTAIKILKKYIKFLLTMLPDHKGIINISPPYQRFITTFYIYIYIYIYIYRYNQPKRLCFDFSKGPLNCDSKNVIYLLNCRICQAQYIGSTKTKFRTRFNNYKSAHRKFRENFYEGSISKIPQQKFHEQFCQNSHNGITDWEVVHLLTKLNLRVC